MERLLLRVAFSACVIIGAVILNSFSGGGFSNDLTGSPVSSSTCQSCHSTYSLNSGSGSVSMSIPTSYYPGNSYSISINVSQSSPTPARFGFMAGVLRDNNANGGTFAAGTGSAVTTISGRSYIRHNSTYNSSGSWSYSWTAPSYADTIIFHYAGVAANGTSGNSGDYVYTGSTTIYPINLITATVDSTGVTCNGDCDGSISVSNVSGGEGAPYTYEWSNNATTASINNLCAGTYTLTITDNNGNEEVIEASVDTPNPLVMSFTTVGTSCVSGSGEISVQPFGGTAPYSYLWNTGSTDSLITNANVGTYIVTVTDANGCTSVDSGDVNPTGSGLVGVFNSGAENCGQENGFAQLAMIIGNPPYDYAWSTGSTGSSFEGGLSAGTYTVTVTDSLGCIDLFSETIDESFAVINEAGASINDATCFGDSNGSISVPPGQAIPPAFYDWSNGATGLSIFDLTAGMYTVTLTDSAGCMDTATFEVSQPDVMIVGPTPVSTNEGFCDGTIVLNAKGGTPPYAYSWSHDATLTGDSASGLCEGVFTVTVTDDQGCEQELVISIGVVTGNEELSIEAIGVYPNPAHDVLLIRTGGLNVELVELMDMTGRKIKTWSEQVAQLNIDGIESGRYNLLIRAGDGFIVKPLVISR